MLPGPTSAGSLVVTYAPDAPSKDRIDALPGATVLDFGTDWCGWCRAAVPLVDEVLGARPDVRHLRVEDGKGRPLGRAFRVKLWPTLVFLRDGHEVARVVRPQDAAAVREALEALAAR
jgi:thioredoxin 1